MGNNMLQLAQQFMNNVVSNGMDKNLVNAPWKQEAINAILSGDSKRGEELANNLLKSYGFSSPEEAVQKGLQNLGGKT